MRKRLAILIGLMLCGLSTAEAGPGDRIVRVNVVFVSFCDGLNLFVLDRLGVLGVHTGCGGEEFVSGSEFVTEDGETGITVTFFDKTSGRRMRYDLFRSGFRANKFYQYDVRTDTLLRYGSFQPAPPPI